MEAGDLMLHSQGLSNNPSPEPNKSKPFIVTYILSSILTMSFHLRLGLRRGRLPVDSSVNILKAILCSSILAACLPFQFSRFNHPDYMR